MYQHPLISEAQSIADPTLATFQQGFFQTHKGGYGEGDIFLGLTVPQTRTLAKKYKDLPLPKICQLLQHPLHEIRLTALHMLVAVFDKAKDTTEKKHVVDLYLEHLPYINNWDLVDTSAHKILGRWLADQEDRSLLLRLAEKEHLWTQRVAVVSTLWLIKNGSYNELLQLATLLLHHPHDLMHKAIGWMLREVGKKDLTVLHLFLQKHAHLMPRTMLRYAIEKLPPEERLAYRNQSA